MDKKVEYTISLKDLFSASLKNAMHSSEEFGKGVDKNVSSIKNLIMTGELLYGIKEAFRFAKEMVSDFDNAAVAVAQMNASLSSTGGTAGITSEALQKQAEQLSEVTRYSKTATEGMESILLIFTNIKGEILKQTIPAVQNMASKLGMDLPEAAKILGKGLNDPIRGMALLRREGLSFSKEQQNTIKSMVATNNVAGAQQLILDQLAQKFGGSAEAAAKAGSGPFTVFSNKMEETRVLIGSIFVAIGQSLIPVLNWLSDAFKTSVQWIKDHSTFLKALAVGIGVVVAGYLTWIGIIELATWWTGTSTAAIILNTLATEGWEAAQLALNIAMEANPVGILIMALAALAAGIYYAYQKSESFRKVVKAIGWFFGEIWKFIKWIWGGIEKALDPMVKWIEHSKTLQAVFKGIGETISAIGDTFTWIENIIERIILWLSGVAWGDTQAMVDKVKKEEDREDAEQTDQDQGRQGSMSGGKMFSLQPKNGNGTSPTATGGGGAIPKSSEISGKTPTTINITIGSLIGKFETHVQNFTQSIPDAAEQLSKALVGVVNDANRIQ